MKRDADVLAACAFVFCTALGFVFASIEPAKRSLPRYLPIEGTWCWGTEDDARKEHGAEVTIDWYGRSAAGLGSGLVGGLLAWLLVAALRQGKEPSAGGAAVAWELAALGLGLAVFLLGLFAAKGIWRF
ncbi:MAG: hypothetical protein AAB434_05785 [Planctomycetota bacterium]